MRPSLKASIAKASTRGRTIASRSVPAGRRSRSVIFQPLMKHMVSTLRPEQESMGSGQPTSTLYFFRARQACEQFTASSLKSTSSREARRHSLSKSVASGASGWYFIARAQMNSIVLRSVPTMAATPWCCTLTQTFLPVDASTATCACATLAEAIGRSSNDLKTVSSGRPRSARTVLCTSRKEDTGSSSCRLLSSSTHGWGNSPALIEAA
mmetsp:Transcript_71867/g.188349  ORF Transcript_71867/g.188349 Transcript_71867/m.188349 type:complete len:210 (+) Transcript_71867:278-907(+)